MAHAMTSSMGYRPHSHNHSLNRLPPVQHSLPVMPYDHGHAPTVQLDAEYGPRYATSAVSSTSSAPTVPYYSMPASARPYCIAPTYRHHPFAVQQDLSLRAMHDGHLVRPTLPHHESCSDYPAHAFASTYYPPIDRERGYSLSDPDSYHPRPSQLHPSQPAVPVARTSPSLHTSGGHMFTPAQTQMQLQMIQSRQQPTYVGLVRTMQEALKLLTACDLPDDTPNNPPRRIPRRLLDSERADLVQSGNVFVWDEEEAGIRRWTDGRVWSASRVNGCFLTYRELLVRKHRTGAPGCPTQNKYKVDGLIKQSFTMTTTSGRKLHIISYYHKRDLREHLLRRIDDDPRFYPSCPTGWPIKLSSAEYPDPELSSHQTEDQETAKSLDLSSPARQGPYDQIVPVEPVPGSHRPVGLAPTVKPTESALNGSAVSLPGPPVYYDGWNDRGKRMHPDTVAVEYEFSRSGTDSMRTSWSASSNSSKTASSLETPGSSGSDPEMRRSWIQPRWSSQSTIGSAGGIPVAEMPAKDHSAAGALLCLAKDDVATMDYYPTSQSVHVLA